MLGPLEVFRDGEEVALARGRPRALLALLLLRRNEVVPVDRLVEAVWDGMPPSTATKILQLYISRLRKALPEAALRTRPPGYVLELDERELDSACFERLVADARLAPPAGAAQQLRDALALWPAATDLVATVGTTATIRPVAARASPASPSRMAPCG